jgi:hypothetical protein
MNRKAYSRLSSTQVDEKWEGFCPRVALVDNHGMMDPINKQWELYEKLCGIRQIVISYIVPEDSTLQARVPWSRSAESEIVSASRFSLLDISFLIRGCEM